MKIPANVFLPIAAAGAALLLTGCEPRANGAGNAAASPAEPAEPVVFSPEQGLALARLTRESLQLATAPVRVGRFVEKHHAIARRLEEQDGEVCLRAVVPADRAPKNNSPIEIAAGPATVQGRIREIDRQLERVSGEVELLICVDARAMEKLGSRVRVSYPLSEERESFTIPTEGLIRAALGDFVYVENDGHYRRHRVRVGMVEEGRAEILDGIKATDAVVTRGADQLWILELAMVGGMSNLDSLEGGARK